MTTFTPIELQLIEREMQIKSAGDIAFLLDAPVDDVKATIAELTGQSGIVSKQAAIDQREAKRPTGIKKPKKEKQPKEFLRVIDKHSRERRNYLETRNQYKTKIVDYTPKKLVKLIRIRGCTWMIRSSCKMNNISIS